MCHMVGGKRFSNGRKNDLERKLLYFREHVNNPFFNGPLFSRHLK